jgi:hypothetical protein
VDNFELAQRRSHHSYGLLRAQKQTIAWALSEDAANCFLKILLLHQMIAIVKDD